MKTGVQTSSANFFFAAAFSISLSFACNFSHAQTPSISYLISPQTVISNQAFTLKLLSYQFNCGTSFTHQSSAVSGNRITLTFLDHTDSNAICPALVTPYGPSFALAGLKAGAYAVYAARLPACYDAGCLIPVTSQWVDTLRVRSDSNWYLEPNRVAANQAFNLQFLSYKYGNCQTSFSHVSMEATSAKVHASFVIEQHPEKLCLTDTRPFGPSFAMTALKAGKYQATVSELPACLFAQPACLVTVQEKVVDTLTVQAAAVVSTHPKGARVQTIRNGLLLSLPAELRTVFGRQGFRAEVYSPLGARIEGFQISPESERGLYRLQSTEAVRPGWYLLKVYAPGYRSLNQPFVWMGL